MQIIYVKMKKKILCKTLQKCKICYFLRLLSSIPRLIDRSSFSCRCRCELSDFSLAENRVQNFPVKKMKLIEEWFEEARLLCLISYCFPVVRPWWWLSLKISQSWANSSLWHLQGEKSGGTHAPPLASGGSDRKAASHKNSTLRYSWNIKV